MPIYGEPLPPYPEPYRKGVWLFNQRYFFECHEILEDLWRESIGSPKLFYQTLIHAAVCFVHWERENRRGVLSLQHTFNLKCDQLGTPEYMGLDLARLQREMAGLVDPIRKDESFPLQPFDQLLTPKIFVPPDLPQPVEEEELKILGRHEKS